MKNSDRYIAVDFGSTQLRTILAEVLENNSVRVLSYESKNASDVKNGIIEQPSGAAFKAGGLIKLLHNSSRISGKISKFSTSLNAKSMKVISFEFKHHFRKDEEITQQLLDKLFKMAKQELLNDELEVFQMIPVQYDLNEETVQDPIGAKAHRVEILFHVVVGSEKIILNLNKCLDRMPGFQHEGGPFLSMEALAIAVTEEEERKQGCALINLGATTTTVAIYKDEILQELKVIPLGGMSITHDIVEFGISEQHAEKLKRLKGFASEQYVENPVNIQIPAVNPQDPPVKLSTTFLSTMIEARLEEILEPVFGLIAEYGEELHKIIISGGASALQMLPEYIGEKTGLEVRYGDHSGWLSSEDTPDEFRNPEYAQLIGTILLAHEYRSTLAVEDKSSGERAKKKSDGGKITDKITQGIFRLFEDDQELQE